MKQVTWRAPEELVEAVREIARQNGHSLNEYLTQLAQAATDPAFAEDDAKRLRERLARAGLLAPSDAPVRRPDPEAVARARRDAGRGTPLADLVGDSRR
jgi:hypothetical protein